jgi:uncharacterized membrane protein YeaQ/YmgE (transglycosylase-associated protein family)
MDIAGLLMNVVSGAIGGNLTGAGLKQLSLGTIGNTIAGLVGGAAGGYILKAVDILNTAGLANMSVGSIASEAGATAICGAILTAIVGFIKNKTSQ